MYRTAIVLTTIGLFVALGLLGIDRALAQGPKGSMRTASTALGTAFTYQGQLKQGTTLVNGTCNLRFGLWSAASAGDQAPGSPLLKTGVPVTQGLFTVELDFGAGAFTGEARWLEIEADCTGGGFILLSPRQAVLAAPYALYAAQAGSAASAWNLAGNGSTTYDTNFIGTTNNVSLTLKVNGQTGWRLAPSAPGKAPNVIGGSSANVISATVYAGTIGGGGDPLYPNQVWAPFGTVGGGAANTASRVASTVGGGDTNTASEWCSTVAGGAANTASGKHSTVGGGGYNTASGTDYSTVGGGGYNTASELYSTVGGGSHNSASGELSTVAGGYYNTSSDYASTVAGGYTNIASNDWTTVGGGYDNHATYTLATIAGGAQNTASGFGSTIPGGLFNSATLSFTLAAGQRAQANHQGSFVWADSTDADFSSTGNDEFLVRAAGGVGINTNSPAINTLTVGGDGLKVATGGTTFKKIESGTANIGSHGDTGVKSVTVFFPSDFATTPKLVATARGENYGDTFVVSTRAVTAHQFVINVYRVDITGGTWTQNLNVDWIAWE